MAAPHDLPLGGPTPPPKKVPPTTDKPVAKKPPAKKAPLGLNGQANAIVNSELNPVVNQAKTSNLQQTQAIASFTKMLLAALQGTPASIGAGYDKAIGTQTNIANAAADALRNANPNQQDQHILDAVGAPDSQKNQLFGHLADTFGGGAAVGQYNNLLRTNDLQANKLASVNFAKTLPAIEGLRGNQALQNALYTQQKGMSDLLSQRPKLLQDALNSLYDQSAKQQQLDIERQSFGLKAQNQDFTQSYKVATLKEKQNEFIAKADQKTADGRKPNASLSRADGYVVDSSGNPILKNGKRQILPGFNTNAQGRVVKAKSSSARSAAKLATAFPNLTKTQVQHLRGGIANSFYGYKDKKGASYGPYTYQEAIKFGVEAGYSRAAATRMANRFYAPGVRGRPGGKSQVDKYKSKVKKTNKPPLGPPAP